MGLLEDVGADEKNLTNGASGKSRGKAFVCKRNVRRALKQPPPCQNN